LRNAFAFGTVAALRRGIHIALRRHGRFAADVAAMAVSTSANLGRLQKWSSHHCAASSLFLVSRNRLLGLPTTAQVAPYGFTRSPRSVFFPPV
jgi:hypothetical protein